MQRALIGINRAARAAIVGIAALILAVCSFSLDDGSSPTPVPKKADKRVLDKAYWEELLDWAARQDSPVTLDLSDCEVQSNTVTSSTGKVADYLDATHDGDLVNAVLFKWIEKMPEDPPGTNVVTKEWVVFDPKREISRGKDKIVELILPDKAEIIRDGHGTCVRMSTDEKTEEYGMFEITIVAPAFNHFTNLKKVTGQNVKQIRRYAFAGLKSLESVDFPNVTHGIGKYELATTWATIVSPTGSDKPDGYEQRDIDFAAFYGCTALKDVKIPNAMVISIAAFQGCTSLRDVNFPSAWLLHQHAFEGCTGLTQVNFPAATKIGNCAFRYCTNLTTAVFPKSLQLDSRGSLSPPISTCGNRGNGLGGDEDKAFEYSIVIFNGAFYGCRALKTIEIRNAWNVKFGTQAFADIGKTLDIYLSDERHSLDDGLCFGKDILANNFTSISLETIYFHGLKEDNFKKIKDDLDKSIPHKPSSSTLARINIVQK